MEKTLRKPGRKQRHYLATWGETIVGLSRRPSDGRGRVIDGPHKDLTYSEPDEHKAVERFYALDDPILTAARCRPGR